MTWMSRIIDAGAEYRYELAEIRAGLFIGEGNTKAKLTQFWVLLVLSSSSPRAASSATRPRR